MIKDLLDYFRATCKAFTPASEIYVRSLYDAVKELDARTILEIGIGPEAVSGTTFAWAMAENASGTLVSIDLDAERPTRAQIHTIDEMGVRWFIHHGDSRSPHVAPPALVYDILYIDGDHGAAHVESDFTRFSPLVRKGGLIIFDDYTGGALHAQFGFEGEVKKYDESNGNSHFFYKVP